MANKLNVIFMGTPDFAVPSLSALYDHGYNVSLVVTRPDQPKGRGRKLSPPPLKTAAEKLNIPIFQTGSIKGDDFNEIITGQSPDVMVVVAFGYILPKKILEIPKYGTINVHASLLPRYRGPAPIQWAIINGEKQTGVTTMMMDKGLDTGEILLSSPIKIDPEDTAGTLHDRLSSFGADLLIQTLEKIEDGSLKPVTQNHAQATYAPMLKKADGHIDWGKSAIEIERFIRGVNPWPCAFTFFDQKRIRIFRAKVVDDENLGIPGEVIKGFSNELLIATGKGSLSILELQIDSGKRLPISEYLKGADITPSALMT